MQMAARGRGRGRGRGNGNGGNAPITVEELMQTQNKMMHVFMQHESSVCFLLINFSFYFSIDTMKALFVGCENLPLYPYHSVTK